MNKSGLDKQIEEIINNVGYEFEWEIAPSEATGKIMPLVAQAVQEARDEQRESSWQTAKELVAEALSSQKAQIVERLEGLRKMPSRLSGWKITEEEETYNEAIDDAISAIKEVR